MAEYGTLVTDDWPLLPLPRPSPPSPQYIRDDGLVETITVDDLAASQRDMVLYLCRDN